MDKYKIVKVIGKGNYGNAHWVRNIKDGNLYVIKTIDISNFNQEDLDSALYEVNILKSLNHPYIIKYIESFYEDNFLCIVTEYADCGDMNKWIQSQIELNIYWKEDIVLNWFVQLCFAVKYIHDKKILHRDLKLSNVFLCSSGDIKWGDFGIAKVWNNTKDLAKTLVGTPFFLSPELCLKKAYNNKSDIWSWGCVLYELMNLKHAFEADNIGELILKILKGDLGPMSKKFTVESRAIVKHILITNCEWRPDINKILNETIWQRYIKLNLIKQISKKEENEPHETNTNNTDTLSSKSKVNSIKESASSFPDSNGSSSNNNNNNNNSNSNNPGKQSTKIQKSNVRNLWKNKGGKDKNIGKIISNLKEENSNLKSQLKASSSNSTASAVKEATDTFTPDYSWEKTEDEFILVWEVPDVVTEWKSCVNVIEGNYLFKVSGVKSLSHCWSKSSSNKFYYSSNRKEGKFLVEFTIPIQKLQLNGKKCKKFTHENGVYVFHYALLKDFEEESFEVA